jgi:hypothetical protein
LDFTKRGDNELITIKDKSGKERKVKKDLIEPTELFETGVYNSETDTNNNPKTGENTPDKVGAVVNRLSERLREIVASLDELRLFVKDNSSLSHASLDTCISEINTYISSLEDESKQISSESVN